MLEKYRKEIDQLDKEIIDKLKERSKMATHIAIEKLKTKSPLFRPDREQAVLDKVAKMANEYLEAESLKNIYREIMSATLKLEGDLKVGYLGPQGSFTHQAALKKFGHSVSLISNTTIEEIFENVQNNKLVYGVIPLENSVEGIVNEALDNLIDFDTYIYSEIDLSIVHNLVGNTNLALSEITQFYTHLQSYRQCKKWIKNNLPNATWKGTTSNSKAVEIVKEINDEKIVAIAPKEAAEYFEVPILKTNINDYANNYTRFIVIGKDKALPGKKNRTSVIFNLSNDPGSLFDIIKPLYQAGINLTCIESRPGKERLWSYIFYLEFEGHIKDKKIEKILKAINKKTGTLRWLGSYPTDKVS